MARLREVEVEVHGERVVLRGDRSLYWPRRRLLAVADLHLGKTESLRAAGVALPDGVLDDDLGRLGRAIGATGAERLLVLGDLVHDAAGTTPAVRRRFAAWRAEVGIDVTLVLGNHDLRLSRMPEEWRLQLHRSSFVLAPFVFSHDRIEEDAGFNWHGHLHPVVTLAGAVDRLRLGCFHMDARRGVLPAFSVLTGGGEVARAPGDRIVAVADGFVVPLRGT